MKRLMTAAAAAAILVGACGASTADESADAADSSTTPAPSTSVAASEPAETSPPVEETSTTTTTEPLFVEETSPPKTAVPGDENVSEPVVSHPNEKVALAMTDLVNRTGADATAINVVSIEEVTWRDGSLGCPIPGMRYTQALVNGERIILEVAGTRYHYHSGGDRDPFYCAEPSDPAGDGTDL